MKLWHYTTGNKLGPILTTGHLIPTGVAAFPEERPTLWFSLNPLWEMTATKEFIQNGQRVRPTPSQLHSVVGLFRFCINAGGYEFVQWPRAAREAGIRRHHVAMMESIGINWGARPSDWFATFEAVPVEDTVFEIWNGRFWAAGDLQMSAELFRERGPRTISVQGSTL